MAPQQIRSWAAVGACAGVPGLAGCGSESSAPPTTPAATATATARVRPAVSAPPFPAALRGTWTRKMTAADWRGAGAAFPTGTWRLDVDAKGAVDVYLPNTEDVDFSTGFRAGRESLTIDAVPICP